MHWIIVFIMTTYTGVTITSPANVTFLTEQKCHDAGKQWERSTVQHWRRTYQCIKVDQRGD